MFNFNIFGGNNNKSNPPAPPQSSMVEKAIKRLYEVPGITNISHRLYLEKASVYVKFKDGSGNLRLFINTFKVSHVYVFDKKNVCHFGGYVGWIHSKGLEEAISEIKKEFDED
jgi:hypothetical protein